jgi:hypothetical protein
MTYFIERNEDWTDMLPWFVLTMAADGIADIISDHSSKAAAADAIQKYMADDRAYRLSEMSERAKTDSACGYGF